ncbi:unnamed protein product [Rotaria sp. Silwood1]|nr:unnamed protein product [Rotaria sp. Silwood1]CAF1589734.1 unnamed protein product [Rotaria sp. Silwood1]CAF1592271.1 unnamed protein product [Rotaria sp. Silwood1]CAF3697469.1 unnamed protein product [Rotaria sp. Silwood1]CAF3713872.1 unnamed protein product [Rotaria sp. Silwood1]
MMILSNFVIFQLSIVILLMTTFITATNIPPSTAMLTEVSQSSDDERNAHVVFPNHHITLDDLQSASKSIPLTDDENLNSEEYDYDYPQISNNKNFWPESISKHYANKVIRGSVSTGNGGDNRLWAIPYRFGKRAAMPYRFGKRAGMHFRLGKKSASL